MSPRKSDNAEIPVNIVKIFTGTNAENGNKLINREFNILSWWSDNEETLAHYYEGCAIEIAVRLEPDNRQEYISEESDLVVPLSEYTYGFAEMECPKGAIWYSFSKAYLQANVIEVKEIFPDLSKYNEEDVY